MLRAPVLLVYLAVLTNSSLSAIKPVDCVEQVCEYGTGGFHLNSFDGNTEVLYKCLIKNVQLTNFYEPVKTQLHVNSSIAVTALGYYGSKVNMKFIPNSVFVTFPNIKYFWIGGVQEFDSLRPEYLKNAVNMKVIDVYSTTISKLDKDVFKEAFNLEYINFHGNMIESVHQLAFNGLKHLKGIYLYNNRITNLHPTTFSQSMKLQDLRLSGNFCRIQNYERANKKFKEIEAEIRKNCEYSPTMEDYVAKVKSLENVITVKVADVKEFEDEINKRLSYFTNNMNLKLQAMEENAKLQKKRFEEKELKVNKRIDELTKNMSRVVDMIQEKYEMVLRENTQLVVRLKENSEVFNEKIRESEMKCLNFFGRFLRIYGSDHEEQYNNFKFGKLIYN